MTKDNSIIANDGDIELGMIHQNTGSHAVEMDAITPEMVTISVWHIANGLRLETLPSVKIGHCQDK